MYAYSYVVNKYFVFKDKRKEHVKQGAGFVGMRVLLLVVANLILYVGVDFLGFHYMVVAVYVSVWDAVISFLIMKLYVFRPATD